MNWEAVSAIDELATKAYPRLSIDLIRSNPVVRDHWNKSTDYSPAFKTWINEKLSESQLDFS